jgi:hypothetical protein
MIIILISNLAFCSADLAVVKQIVISLANNLDICSLRREPNNADGITGGQLILQTLNIIGRIMKR